MECPFRAYLERYPLRDGEESPWRALPSPVDLGALGGLFADGRVGPWLRAHGAHLQGLRLYVLWPGRRYRLRLDGVRWEGRAVHLYRLLGEGAEPDLSPKRRWTEWLALKALLQREDVEAVHLWAWPWLGRPRPVGKGVYRKGDALPALKEVEPLLEKALRSWGAFPPRPGPHCHACGLADLCRKEEE